jgi:hypothetical protein
VGLVSLTLLEKMKRWLRWRVSDILMSLGFGVSPQNRIKKVCTICQLTLWRLVECTTVKPDKAGSNQPKPLPECINTEYTQPCHQYLGNLMTKVPYCWNWEAIVYIGGPVQSSTLLTAYRISLPESCLHQSGTVAQIPGD